MVQQLLHHDSRILELPATACYVSLSEIVNVSTRSVCAYSPKDASTASRYTGQYAAL